MLQMESTMERLRQGVAAQRDRQVRLQSVRKDLELGLPPSIPLPDGEETPYGAASRLHLRDSDQESEIYQKCVRAPPNRTIFDGESPPPYRSNSASGILGGMGGNSGSCGDWSGTTASIGSYVGGFVRCHSLSTSNNPACEKMGSPMVAAAAAALAKKDSAGYRTSSVGKGSRGSAHHHQQQHHQYQQPQHQCHKLLSSAAVPGRHPTAQVGPKATVGGNKMVALPYHCQPQVPPPLPQPPPTSVPIIPTAPSCTAASSPVRMSPPPQLSSNRLGQVHPIAPSLQTHPQSPPRQYHHQPPTSSHPRGPLATTHSRIGASPLPSPTLNSPPVILVPTTTTATPTLPAVRAQVPRPANEQLADAPVTHPPICPSRSHQLCEFSTSPKGQSGVGSCGSSSSGGLLAGLRMVPCMGSDHGVPCADGGSEEPDGHHVQDISGATMDGSVPRLQPTVAPPLARVSDQRWDSSGCAESVEVAKDASVTSASAVNSWDSTVLSQSTAVSDVSTCVGRMERSGTVGGETVVPEGSSGVAPDPQNPAPHEQLSSLTRVNNF